MNPNIHPKDRSRRTGKPICKCKRGYASERDGLCCLCRPPERVSWVDKLAKKACEGFEDVPV